MGSQITTRLVDWDTIYPNYMMVGGVDGPFTDEEIKTAIFDLPGDKAPGPNGFPMLFYQKYWDVVKKDIQWLFEDFYTGEFDSTRINYASIVLIPKIEGANKVSRFRPVSLLNCTFKTM